MVECLSINQSDVENNWSLLWPIFIQYRLFILNNFSFTCFAAVHFQTGKTLSPFYFDHSLF